jgi:hypothetical protein
MTRRVITAANGREYLFHRQAAVRVCVHFREAAIELLLLPIRKRQRIWNGGNARPDRLGDFDAFFDRQRQDFGDELLLTHAF